MIKKSEIMESEDEIGAQLEEWLKMDYGMEFKDIMIIFIYGGFLRAFESIPTNGFELVLLIPAGRVLFGIVGSQFLADFKPQFDVKVATLVLFEERKIALGTLD
ncbi:unnamed protein product [Vicia faba]|uniref:Uncharacterized protein n=1 Tax=Vicia faba TaxID=3906 RepID=A0AAV0YN38_VICFA|nr:unnamed protein product [Vicia faba]